MKTLVRYFDSFLRWRLGVFEFCQQPNCLLRLRRSRAARAVALPDCLIPAGAPILEIHLWNEHIPPLPPAGADIGWALTVQRRLMASFRALARRLQSDPSLSVISAIGGVTVLAFAPQGLGVIKLFERLGFTVYPYRNPLGRFGEFWENFYTWGVMWTFNEVSLRRRRLIALRRGEIWISKERFLARYSEE